MNDKKAYSPQELKILECLPDDGTKVSTLELVAKVYNGRAPLTARQSVLDSCNKLIIKVDLNLEPYEIFRAKPRGPMPIYFWKEPRKVKDELFDLFQQSQ
jgi:hypothetical protein